MALLERVATLLRANLNDMVDRAEDPVKMMNQVILDMQNQLLQVKTQVAIAIADHHLLQRKREEHAAREVEWVRKAEMALRKHDEELARAALQRSLGSRDLAKSFEEQLADQRLQVETLKSALLQLEAKLVETRAQGELLAAQHRRARAANRVSDSHSGSPLEMARARDKINRDLELGKARADLLAGDGVEDRFAQLEKQDEIERLLAGLKSRNGAGSQPA